MLKMYASLSQLSFYLSLTLIWFSFKQRLLPHGIGLASFQHFPSHGVYLLTHLFLPHRFSPQWHVASLPIKGVLLMYDFVLLEGLRIRQTLCFEMHLLLQTHSSG